MIIIVMILYIAQQAPPAMVSNKQIIAVTTPDMLMRANVCSSLKHIDQINIVVKIQRIAMFSAVILDVDQPMLK